MDKEGKAGSGLSVWLGDRGVALGGVGCSRAFFLLSLFSRAGLGAKKLSRWSESSVEASEQSAGAVQCDAVRCGAVQVQVCGLVG